MLSCGGPQNNGKEPDLKQYNDSVECSNLYPFQGYYIELDKNNAVLIDGIPDTDFKKCSKYAHRFTNPVSDSVCLNGKTYVVEKNKDKGIYNINIFEYGKQVNRNNFV